MSNAEDFVASAQADLLALAHLNVGELQREVDDRETQAWHSSSRRREENEDDQRNSEGEGSDGSGADADEDDEDDDEDEDDEDDAGGADEEHGLHADADLRDSVLKAEVMANLAKMVAIVRSAEQENDQGRLADQQHTEIIDLAARAMNKLIESFIRNQAGVGSSELRLFAAETAVIIKHHSYPTPQWQDDTFNILLSLVFGRVPGVTQRRTNPAPSWLSTPRPSPQSNLLARFNPAYDRDRLNTVLDGVNDGSTRDAMRALLQARATFFTSYIDPPTCMSLNDDVLLYGIRDGYKGRLDLLRMVTLPKETAEADDDWDCDEDLITRMGSPGMQVTYDPTLQLIWHDGDQRLKAFTRGRKVKYTLDCSAHPYRWGLTDGGRSVIRGGKDGKFALWNVDRLTAHGHGVVPGGRVLRQDASCFGSLDIGTASGLERSSGDAPHTTFAIDGADPKSVGHLTPLPWTPNAYLFAPPEEHCDGADTDCAIYTVDLGQAGPAAHAVGLGHGSCVTALALDAAVPYTYATACNDGYGRLFDVRHPLPQVIFDCAHCPMRTVAIAPNRGIAPLVFMGSDDALVRAWDARNTKACLYELSIGLMDLKGMAWHEGQQSLFVAGDWHYEEYTPIRADPGRPLIRNEPTRWPKEASYSPNYFGRRYYVGEPALLEYRFRPTAGEVNFY
ncbi:hypothetical protein DENSPDRAFT_505678 [Dentipellis sp. KUC8613]|nr:hypothetical protein DENSPDRAFT_505678 [Dentipellis sp. KUC8613]